ncbi:MAG: hypothetical protein J7M38_15890 [Armatimonadetes bacterium]|nr:hypothetical protein [Armatimonadota bacterium]
MTFWDRLMTLDRRWVFLGIALAVGIPIITGLTLPLGKVAPPTRQVYDAIEALEPGDVVMIAFDYGPSSMPELQPQAMALLRHCFSRHVRVLTMTLTPQGTALARKALTTAAAETGAENGRDYVNLGFKVGGAQVIAGMGESIQQVYAQTADGDMTDSLPVMRGVNDYDDIALVIDLASGDAPKTWIAFARERYHQDIAVGITAVMATDLYPYLQSGQLVGLINGLKGAAEYERLIDATGMGMLGMSAQSIAHLLIIVLVVLGNIAYFASGRGGRERRR